MGFFMELGILHLHVDTAGIPISLYTPRCEEPEVEVMMGSWTMHRSRKCRVDAQKVAEVSAFLSLSVSMLLLFAVPILKGE